LFSLALLGHFQGTQDATEEVVEVMGNAASQLAHGFHFLRLAQGFFDLAHALLFGDARADVVGEQVTTLDVLPGVAQGVVADLVVARGVGRAQGDDVGERLAGQHARPYRLQPLDDVGLVGNELWDIVAHLWHEAAQALEGLLRGAVDRQQTKVAISREHVGLTVVDQFAQQPAVGLGLVDTFLQLLGGRRRFVRHHRGDPACGSPNYSCSFSGLPSERADDAPQGFHGPFGGLVPG